MTEKESPLGELQAVYGTSPAFLQRAAIVAVLSFIFFLVLMIAYSIWQRFVLFLLSTAFLIVELFTLFGWITQRRNEIKVHRNGFVFKKQNYLWDDLKSIAVNRRDKQKIKGEIETKDGKKIVITESVHGVESFFKRVELEINKRK